jgi:ATP-binding cassette subfamily B (MDR/TAP) protein 1
MWLTPVFAIYAAYALAFFYGGILVYNGEADVGQVINGRFNVLE